ncbi:response regulator [Oceanotoga sp. DSM 15011]|nr:response regulator [Oceanotoga sp. DSM 15011]UYO99100.1 response regulator [Oceanotoga sp. DSM 15011]
MNSKKPILLVEDDRIDAMSVKRSLQELKIVNDLIIRNNGEEALKYLLDSENEIPCIILLDLNMPKMNGIDFLRERIKYDNLKLIPTVVLTTSREEQDRVNSFSLGVSGFMIKPVDYKQFVDVIKTIDLYWSLSELP